MNAELKSLARDCNSDANCSGHGTCSGGLCVCTEGYGGRVCSRVCPGSTFATNGTATQICSGHGTCVRQLAARCRCDEGYRLSDCSQQRPVPGEPASVQSTSANESAVTVSWEEPANAQTAADGDYTGAEYVVETCQVALGGCDDGAGLAQSLVEHMAACDMCVALYEVDAGQCTAECQKQWTGDCARVCASAAAGHQASLAAADACRSSGLCTGTTAQARSAVQSRARTVSIAATPLVAETSNWRVACRVSRPPCVITSLSRGTAYKVRVRGKFRKSLFGSFSQVVQIATQANAPDYEVNTPITNTSVTDSSIQVQIVPPRDIGGGEVQARIQRYRVEYRPSGSSDPYSVLVVNTTEQNTAPNVTLTGLARFTAYDIRTAAENVAGYGSPSQVVTQKTRGVCGDSTLQSGDLGNGVSYTEECDGGHCCTSSCTLKPASECSNNGQCVAAGTCQCSSGFVGTNCQYSNQTTCSGNGIVNATGSCTCFPGFSGAACGSANAASCQSLRDASGGSSLSDGIYNISDASGYFLTYCHFDGTSGYDVLFTLSSTDSTVREFDDNTFWEGTTTYGTPANAPAGEFKGQAYSRLAIGDEIKIQIMHQDGRQVGYAKYPVLEAFKEATWRKLMEVASPNTVITGVRSAGAQDSTVLSYTHNSDRSQSLSGDPFLNHNHALKINLEGTLFSSDNTKVRVMTTVDNSNYPHTFAGLGGYHQESSWAVRYEAAPISAYCDLRDAYGTTSQQGNSLEVSGYAYAIRDSCRNGAFKVTPVSTRFMSKGRPGCGCYAVGSNGNSCPEAQCSCKAGFTGTRCEQCASGYSASYDSYGRITACISAQVSCQAHRNVNASMANGAFRIIDGSEDYLSYCYVLGTKSYDLLLTLNTHDNTIRDFSDTTFWTSTTTFGSATNNPVLNEFKGTAFSHRKLSSELMVSIQISGVEQGRSTYNVLSTFQQKSLQEVLTQYTSNTIITSTRTNSQITHPLDLIHNPDRNQQLYGDLFIDHPNAVMVNQIGSHWGSESASTRLATTMYNTQYGHTFAGIGGYHNHGSWDIHFEAAPISPYCAVRRSYGTSSWSGHAHTGSESNFPYQSNCITSFKYIPVEISIWAR